MTRAQVKEILKELQAKYNENNENEEDFYYALDFAIADLNTLQNVIDDVDGIVNE